MNKVIARSNYRRKTHWAFQMFHMWRRSFLPYLVIGAVFVVVGMAFFTASKQSPGETRVIIGFVIAAACVMMLPLMLIFRYNDIVKAETKFPGLKQSVEIIEISKHKVERNNTAIPGRLTLSWKQIDSIYETKKYVFIYTTDQNGLAFPKNDIEVGDLNTLRELCREHTPKNKRGKPRFYISRSARKDTNV